MISFNSYPERFKSYLVETRNWISQCAKAYQCEVETLSYTFLDAGDIQSMNQKFLKHDYPTDIITFDYSTGTKLKGEIYVGLEVVADNADELGLDYWDELCRVMVHGVLHMIGFDDREKQDAKEMRENEDKCLLLRPKNLINNKL